MILSARFVQGTPASRRSEVGTVWRNGNGGGESVNQLALVTTRDSGDLLGEGLG